MSLNDSQPKPLNPSGLRPAPKRLMYRSDLMAWLAQEGFTERQVRRLIEAKVIRRYRWTEILGPRARNRALPGWAVFMESQVQTALATLGGEEILQKEAEEVKAGRSLRSSAGEIGNNNLNGENEHE